MMESAGKVPDCKYGAECYRKNPEHWLQFWHPPTLKSGMESDDGRPSNDASTKQFSEIRIKSGEGHAVSNNRTSIVGEGQPTQEGQGPVIGSYERLLKKEEDGNKATDTSTPFAHGEAISRDNGGAVVLMLVGPPGSGKSTFCHKVMENAARNWIRICQDVISHGKRGTKVQCLKQAAAALSAGNSILIDRCNIDVNQRSDFIQLVRRKSVEAHALVLNLPASVCVQRAMQRTGHEGGLQGADVAGVVLRFSRGRKPPTLEEGFIRITYCRTDTEVENAVSLYMQLSPGAYLPSGIFGASVKEGKGTLKPFRQSAGRDDESEGVKGQPVQHASSHMHRHLGAVDPSNVILSDISLMMNNNSSTDEKVDRVVSSGIADAGEDEGTRTLAFPSISTADFQFDHEKAADIIVETVSDFLRSGEYAGLRLVFVDLLADSDMLARVSRKAMKGGLDPQRFLTFAGDITKMRSTGGPRCNVVANAANWRLKPGGGGVNAAIYKAAGPGLEQATKQRAKTLIPGSAVLVPLPVSSPLRSEEGVTHVIHVLGPNMNPKRPNYLAGDYTQGAQLLRATYVSLFSSFSTVAKPLVGTPIETVPKESARMDADASRSGKSGSAIQCSASSTLPKPVNAFTMLMQAAKRKGTRELDTKSKRERPAEEVLGGDDEVIREGCGSLNTSVVQQSKGDEVGVRFSGDAGFPNQGLGTASPQDSQRGTRERNEDRPVRRWGSWAQSLRNIALHPERHASSVLQVTDEAVVVVDLYPKGKKHVLVVARRDGLDSIDDVRGEHLPSLRHLHSLGQTWARSFLQEDPSLIFRLGYHSVPSMQQLHLHVISQDFDSPNLKNKKHWNSFTSGFFRDSQDILNEVEKNGQVKPCSSESEKSYLAMELRCHRCRSAQPNMPRLKNHLHTCNTPLSSDLPQHPYLVTSSSIELP